VSEAAGPGPALFGAIRSACAEVTRRARWLRVDDGALEAFAAHLAAERPGVPELDPAQRPFASPETTVAFVLTLDTINFGSGWFPHLQKRPGLSGYRTLASALRERFEREGPLAAEELRKLASADCARLLQQPLRPPLDELMGLYARALGDLGELLASAYRGRFAGPVEEAGGSAARLVATLARMPLFRDESRYQELVVPFYKRAQITCADLAAALGGRGLGRFHDLDRLTLFADNLVPHVLRMLGVLVYDLRLAARIDAEELLPWGSEEEVEIRAAAVTATERLAAACARRGFALPVHRLDALLWTRGQHPRIKARPRHRTRCTAY
jgi:hypothetical protein